MPLTPQRTEILKLRARMVVAERAALAALETTLRIRPEELENVLSSGRQSLAQGYLDAEFATDLSDPGERAFVAQEVDRLMELLMANMGFLPASGDADDG